MLALLLLYNNGPILMYIFVAFQIIVLMLVFTNSFLMYIILQMKMLFG